MTYRNYEWTAFTESDLLQGGDTNLGNGDSFTMPGAATVTMSTWDNDRSLSGDNWYNENANDSSGQLAVVDGARVGCQLYAESYHVLHGSDGKTYYLIEIEVEGYDAPGVGQDFFTFYGSVPPAGTELTLTQTCNVTGCWVDYKCIGAGDTVPPNTPPTFTNLPADGILCIDENNTLVIDTDASDVDGDALTYSITGGRDASFFEIDAATGELSFIDAPDFENPQSGGNSNTYDVTITVDDGNGGLTEKALWVKVKDVAETGSVSGNVFCDLDCDGLNDTTTTTEKGPNLIVNGDFEDNCLNDSGYTWGGLKSGWYDIGTQKVNIIEQDYGHGNSTGDAIAELECGVIICQVVDVTDAGKYCLTFDVSRRGNSDQDNKFELFIDGQKFTTVIAQGQETLTFELDLTAGEHRFDFKSLSQSYIGAGLDDVKLEQIVTTVATEGPKEDVTVKLVDTNGNVVATTTTDENGDYKFEDVDVGDYQIMVVAPDGQEFTFQDVGNDDSIDSDVDAGGISGTFSVTPDGNAVIDAGLKEVKLGSLSGRFFTDTDDDNQDNGNGGEPAVAGVQVELLNADGTGTGRTVLTDANGNYSFDGLAAGVYGVSFTDPDGVLVGTTLIDANVGSDASDSDAIGDTTLSTISSIVVTAGNDTPDNDAGVETLPGALSGTYFCDENDDGVDGGAASGDADVVGKLVTLLNADGTAAVDLDGNPVLAVLTDASGNYRFDNLAAGDYKVAFQADGEKRFVAQNVGNDDMVDSDVDENTGVTDAVTVVAGQETTDVDAGIKDPGTASLGDLLFNDIDGNGQQDAGEDGVEGVEVTLINTNGGPNQTTTTNAQGNYLFNNLKAGSYQVLFDAVDGFDFTTADQGNDATDSDVDAAGLTGTYVLGIGEQNLTVDAGIVAQNEAPTPADDAGMGCAEDDISVNVLANDTDPENDALTVTAVNGVAINDGDTIVIDGVDVTLENGELTFNGAVQFAGLDIGQEATVAYTYTVSDGQNTAEAEAAVTFCGDANTVDSLVASLPAGSVSYKIQASNIALPVEDYAFNLQIVSSGDARFDGEIYADAYCLGFGIPISQAEILADAPIVQGEMFGTEDAVANGTFNANQISVENGQAAADNLDLISWILNQEFEGNGFSGWEVQRAIWELTDSTDLSYLDAIHSGFGTDANVDNILAQAALHEGFEAGVGDKVAVIVDPGSAVAANQQPFIIAIDFEDYDCIC